MKAQCIQQLKTRCIAPGFEEMDLVVFSEPPDEERQILEAALTAPFGSSCRLVVVDGLETIDEKTLPWLPGYLKSPHPKTCLVLCAQRLERGIEARFLHKKDHSVQLLSCQSLKGAQLKDWIVTQAQQLGKKIEPDAAVLLSARAGSNLQLLILTLESLTLLVGESPRITRSDVEALVTPAVGETAFDILDTAASGRPESALAQLRRALAQGTLTVEQLMGALGWYYRMAWKARWRGIETWSPTRRGVLERLNRWPEGKLRRAFDDVLEADVSLKLSHPAPELLADQLLLALAGRVE